MAEYLSLIHNGLDFLLALALKIAALTWLTLLIAQLWQRPVLLAMLRGIFRSFKRLKTYLATQARDPVRYPRVERLLQSWSIVQAYTMAAILALYFLLFIVLGSLAFVQSPSWKPVGAWGFGFFCVYMASVLKAQGGRERMRLRRSASKR